jgi:hypothetical protein
MEGNVFERLCATSMSFKVGHNYGPPTAIFFLSAQSTLKGVRIYRSGGVGLNREFEILLIDPKNKNGREVTGDEYDALFSHLINVLEFKEKNKAADGKELADTYRKLETREDKMEIFRFFIF